MQLKGKHVVLTGATGGIGCELLERVKQAGARVTTVGRKSDNDIQADLSDPAGLSDLCAKLAKMDVDVLLNNAGLIYFGTTTDQQAGNVEALLRVNLEAPIRLAQAVIPGMIRRGGGQIVNIGSIVGSLAMPHFTVYSATKAGLKNFSEGLRREYDGKGLSVTYIAPRAVDTAMSGGIVDDFHKRVHITHDSPEKVADIIVDAILKDKKDVYIGFPESLFARINALLPRVIDSGLLEKRDVADEMLKSQKAS
ncbi:MAG: SDR family NAD(P)-dependent oxidoreductase [Rhodospirillales bacterium]|nr:SDR family NAD(P)-dependent oxidoreductase [Rhodospirillales bacterium]